MAPSALREIASQSRQVCSRCSYTPFAVWNAVQWVADDGNRPLGPLLDTATSALGPLT